MIEINKLSEVTEHLSGIQAVIFDLDDTLYNEKAYVRSGYYAVAECLPEVKDAEEKLWHFFEEGKSAIDELLKAEGLFTEERKRTCLQTYREHIPTIFLDADVRELLLRLRSEGRFLGIITDGRPEGQRAKIKALGLEALADAIIVTDELGGVECRKPSPLAFEKMREIADVPYDQMCYIGDNTKKDFIAPDKLGMRSIWYCNSEGFYSGR